MDGTTFVNRQIDLLQAGIVNSKLLNYLESKPGMSIKELVDFKQVYPDAEEEKRSTSGCGPLRGGDSECAKYRCK